MNFKSKLKAIDLKAYLRSMVNALHELPEQKYSFGFVIQKAEPSLEISTETTVNELTNLMNAVGQFKDDEEFMFEIKMPIYSEVEDAALKLIQSKYDAVKALTPKPHKLIKV
jgi:hypothetical protein